MKTYTLTNLILSVYNSHSKFCFVLLPQVHPQKYQKYKTTKTKKGQTFSV